MSRDAEVSTSNTPALCAWVIYAYLLDCYVCEYNVWYAPLLCMWCIHIYTMYLVLGGSKMRAPCSPGATTLKEKDCTTSGWRTAPGCLASRIFGKWGLPPTGYTWILILNVFSRGSCVWWCVCDVICVSLMWFVVRVLKYACTLKHLWSERNVNI